MNILGLETSCDETAASLVKNGKRILSNIVVTSLNEHKPYGGVLPELASRRQIEYINAVVKKSLSCAHLNLRDIDAVAVASSPGLIGSLLVGISFGRALSFALNKPFIHVDHIKSHIYANFLTPLKNPLNTQPKLPAVGLVVSGGHTSLYRIKNFTDFKLLGQTQDDAAGEAFDKVAKILNLEYPGGPAIEKAAQTIKKTNIRFTCAHLPGTLDFSFSGIKTAVLYYKRRHENEQTFSVSEVSFAFQDSLVKVLVQKCIQACHKIKTKTLLLGGGVAANSQLRQQLAEECQRNRIQFFFPPIHLCTDNAAMIAGLGFHWLKKKKHE